MNLGAVFPQAEFTRVDPDELVTFAQRLEDAGYDHLLVYDHVLGADSDARADWERLLRPPRPVPRAADAVRVPRTRLQARVRHRRAGAPAASDRAGGEAGGHARPLAPGRVRLGVGIGWNSVDTTRSASTSGARDTVRGADRSAAPALDRTVVDQGVPATPSMRPASRRFPRQPVPIWFGTATVPRALARVGRLADGWIPMPMVQPGTGFDEAWAGRARRGGRGRTRPGDDRARGQRPGPGRRGRNSARSGGALARRGAGAVALNPLRDEARWPDGHLERAAGRGQLG